MCYIKMKRTSTIILCILFKCIICLLWEINTAEVSCFHAREKKRINKYLAEYDEIMTAHIDLFEAWRLSAKLIKFFFISVLFYYHTQYFSSGESSWWALTLNNSTQDFSKLIMLITAAFVYLYSRTSKLNMLYLYEDFSK